MRTGISILILSWPFFSHAIDYERIQIEQRISPIGQVRVEGAEQSVKPEAHAPAEKKEVAQKVAGQETYEKFCATCHATGLAGAPKFRVENDWKPRLAKGEEVLLKNATKGMNAMPPKGTCTECSEDDLKVAIHYMIEEKK